MKTYKFIYFPTFSSANLVAAISGKEFTSPLTIMDLVGTGLASMVITTGANIVMCVDASATVTLTDTTGTVHSSAPVTEAIKAHLLLSL